jgi:hypothetical protein
VFWMVTQPTNRYWLKNQRLGKAGARFFTIDQMNRSGSASKENPDWKRLRNRWEYSHIARAILSAFALVALVVAILNRSAALQ